MKKLLLLIFGCTFLVSVNAQELDSLRHQEYLRYVERVKDLDVNILSEAEWDKRTKELSQRAELMNPSAPGTYLIKAKNLILTGITLQIISGIGAVGTAFSGLETKTQNIMFIGMGALSLTGFVLEIGGVVNIGKAGVLLNENGVGLRINF